MTIIMPLPDVIDRYCIALLKHERSGEDFSRELDTLGAEFDRASFKKRRAIYAFIDELLVVHSDIWDAETEIRQCCEAGLGLEEVGRRALLVRDFNKYRQTVKNRMISAFGEGFYDCKVNYGDE